jgi:hypothetical protein
MGADVDPVHAAHGLLERRRDCLAHRNPECLAAVDQPGSPLLAADIELAAAGASLATAPALSRLSLSEALGDAAIVAIAPSDETTKPASVLVIRTEAGWRLRALFEN